MRFEELSHMMQKPDPKPDTYEAGMAQNQLLKIGTHAIRLHNMIDDGQEMESWVAKKIDLASNYVKSVHGYTAGSKAGTYDDDGMSEARLQSNWAVSFQMPKGNHRRNSFASQDDAEKFQNSTKWAQLNLMADHNVKQRLAEFVLQGSKVKLSLFYGDGWSHWLGKK